MFAVLISIVLQHVGMQGRSYHCFLVAQKPPQELLRKLGRAPYN